MAAILICCSKRLNDIGAEEYKGFMFAMKIIFGNSLSDLFNRMCVANLYKLWYLM